MRRVGSALALGAFSLGIGGCAGSASPPARGPDADILVRPGDTVVGATALPFDPHAGAVASASHALAKTVGHPVVLVLVASQSAREKADLERDVALSLARIGADLALLRREEPALGARIERLERIVVTRDESSSSTLASVSSDGRRLEIVAGFDAYPYLREGSARGAFCSLRFDADDARWRGTDPTRLGVADQRAWFDHVTCRDPLDLWENAGKKRDGLLTVPIDRIRAVERLAQVVPPGSSLDHRVTRFLLDHATELRRAPGGIPRGSTTTADSFETWLTSVVSRLDTGERLALARAVFDRQDENRRCLPECGPELVFPHFDRFGFGLAIFDDARAASSAPRTTTTARRLDAVALCRHDEVPDPPEGCSIFFRTAMNEPAERKRLFGIIEQRHDVALLEAALLDGKDAASMVEILDRVEGDDALFRAGFRLLAYEHVGRRIYHPDVREVLEKTAPRWMSTRHRAQALFVVARTWRNHDELALRFVAERRGAPIDNGWLEELLAEGTPAVSIVASLWPALEKSHVRDDIIARHASAILQQRAWYEPLVELAKRLCSEADAYGIATIRDSLVRWVGNDADRRTEYERGIESSFACGGNGR